MLKNQAVEKKTKELTEKMGRIEEENVQQIVSSIQQTDEFVQQNNKKKQQIQTFK